MHKVLSFFVAIFLLSFLTSCNSTQFTSDKEAMDVQNKAILSLNIQAHTALIKDLIVTKDKEIITAAEDKTIRVWDSKTGQEKRKISGQIGGGSNGMIYAIALSKDEKYLAVGGYLGYNKNYRSGNIRIYNYKSGQLIQVLVSHENVVHDLAFSEDGKYLISGSTDMSAKIWQVVDKFSLLDTIKFHKGSVYGVKIIKKELTGEYFAITVGEDKKIALYDFSQKRVIKYKTCDYKLHLLAINSKVYKGHIAAGEFDGNGVLIFDFNLNLKHKIASQVPAVGLSYSEDGEFLIVGSQSMPGNASIYQVQKDYRLQNSFKKNSNITAGVGFLDEKTAVSAGGNDHEIYIWDIETTKVLKKIKGEGDPLSSVGINGNIIAWGDNDCVGEYCSKFEKAIDLSDFSIHNVKNERFKQITKKHGRYNLSLSKGGSYGYSDAVLNVDKNSRRLASIVKDNTSGIHHRCYGWYKNLIISGGSHGQFGVYNKQGEEVANLVGHTGEILSIALDGDTLVSVSTDKTIRLWNLSKLSSIHKNTILKPTLNIFISRNNEYVAWTKEGFFTASKNGVKYIGYHINQGVDKESRYVSVDRLYNTYYRPDLIMKALQGEDLSYYAKDIDIDKILSSGLAPEVRIVTDLKESKTRDVSLELEVCTVDDGGYDNLTLLLNDMPVDVLDKNRALKLKKPNRMQKNCFNISKLISLQHGNNVIGLKATNEVGNIESNIDTITINYKGISTAKPNLYILSIGIDKYRDGDLWLNYSKADASAFSNTIKSVSESLFKHIYTYSLLDKEVTKSNILNTFTKVGAETTRDDVFILYVAGHGVTDAKTGAYFYLPADFRYKNESSVRQTGVSQSDFTLALSKIKAMKSLTVLDTCNSGSFAEALASRGILQKTAIDKLMRATGRAILTASSKDQVALEGYNGHGVFTYTLMEALKGQGYGSDNKITIKELAAYVEDILPDRTYEKWGYEQVPQSNIAGNDFPIGVR